MRTATVNNPQIVALEELAGFQGAANRRHPASHLEVADNVACVDRELFLFPLPRGQNVSLCCMHSDLIGSNHVSLPSLVFAEQQASIAWHSIQRKQRYQD